MNMRHSKWIIPAAFAVAATSALAADVQTRDSQGRSIAAAPDAVTVAPTPDFSPGRIVLYENPNFSGARVTLDRGIMPDLDWANFANSNHRATSIRVESGTWRVCTQMSFRGECRIVGPGDYPYLAGPMYTGIASAEEVRRPELGALTIETR
jgi:Beta/Gamma crystallin